jgi:phosphatidylglycerophosphate synthase
MLLAVAISCVLGSPWVLSFFAVFSFFFLIFGANRHWTESGAFGLANAVTAFRLGAVVSLPLLSSTLGLGSMTIIGPALLGLDGLDGWLARRRKEASEFGEYFDKETDALFLLFLCLLAALNQRLGSWILVPGSLRYFFVILVHLSRPDFKKETKSGRARIVYSLVMAGALATFLPYPAFYWPLAVIGTTALILSFMRDFYVALSDR